MTFLNNHELPRVNGSVEKIDGINGKPAVVTSPGLHSFSSRRGRPFRFMLHLSADADRLSAEGPESPDE